MKSLLIFLYLVGFQIVSSQTVMRSMPYDLAVLQKRNEVAQIAQNVWNSMLKSVQYKQLIYNNSSSSIKISKVKFLNLQFQDDLEVDFSSFKETVVSGKENLILNYEGIYSIDNAVGVKFNFTGTAKDLAVVLSVSSNLDKLDSDVKANFIFKPQDKKTPKILNQAFQDKTTMKEISQLNERAMRNSFLEYNQKQIESLKSYNVKVPFPEMKIPVNFYNVTGICNSHQNNNVTVTCPYSGSVKEVVRGVQEDAYQWEEFWHDSKNSKVFLHYQLFNDIFSMTTEENKFTFSVDNNSKTFLPFDLTIESLARFFPELYYSYVKTQEIEARVIIHKIFYDDNGVITAQFSCSVTLADDAADEVLSFSSYMTVKDEFRFEAAKIGLKIENQGIALGNIKILNQLRPIDLNEFRQIVELSMNNYLKEEDFFFVDMINMNDYFKYITEVKKGPKGVYIIGQYLYQTITVESLKFLE